MPTKLGLYLDKLGSEPIDTVVELEDIEIMDIVSFGKPMYIHGVNEGTTTLRNVTMSTEGPGSEHVQLAFDDAGSPAGWTEPGGSLVIRQGSLFPNEKFTVWVRATFELEDVADELDFNFVIDCREYGG